MTTSYTHEQKKSLATRIGKITKTDSLMEIFKIIKEDNASYTVNNKNVLLFFHKLKDTTYKKLEQYLHKINKKNTVDATSSSEFQPYSQDDGMGHKLKFSNKEKNLIKKKMYDKSLTDADSDILYSEFDTDKNQSKQPKPKQSKNEKK